VSICSDHMLNARFAPGICRFLAERDGAGAGIFNAGTLTVSEASISDNSAGGDGIGLAFAGGIANSGPLTVIDSSAPEVDVWQARSVLRGGVALCWAKCEMRNDYWR
jgi:hypothetical protein